MGLGYFGKTDLRKIGGLAGASAVTVGGVAGAVTTDTTGLSDKEAQDKIASNMGTGVNAGGLALTLATLAHPGARGMMNSGAKSLSRKLRYNNNNLTAKEAFSTVKASSAAAISEKGKALSEIAGASGFQKFIGNKVLPTFAGLGAGGAVLAKNALPTSKSAMMGVMSGAMIGMSAGGLYSSIGKEKEGRFSQIGSGLGALAGGLVGGAGIGGMVGAGVRMAKNNTMRSKKVGWFTKAANNRNDIKNSMAHQMNLMNKTAGRDGKSKIFDTAAERKVYEKAKYREGKAGYGSYGTDMSFV